MAGAYKLLLSRATVTVTPGPTPNDHAAGQYTAATVTVQDGVATLKVRGSGSITMPVARVERTTAKRATVVGQDGTTWEIVRGCGCGGAR